MIERYVFIKLKSEFTTAQAVAEVVGETERRLVTLPGVASLTVGTAADEVARSSWDLSIVVRFENIDAVEAYRLHPVHRNYVDGFLRPRMESIKAWNFRVPA